VIATQDGWTTATDPANQTLWTFTQAGHPAHPAGVRRQIIEQRGSVAVAMAIRCDGPRPACDQLAQDFERLNAKLAEDMRRPRGG
jgi:hypothetical protein